MVLEHLFPEDWLEKKARYAFLIAVVYSVVGIATSRFLFGANSGIVSVFFTSILIMPYLEKLFEKEEKKEEKEKRFSIEELIKDNRVSIKVYLSIFLGVYITYNLYTFMLPFLGLNPHTFFSEQLALNGPVKGNALGNAFSSSTFSRILSYNWWVLLACFMLALIAGDGAVFFITWNASSWGTIMGYRAVTASLVSGSSPIEYLLLIISITFPHMILEALSYILAAISGSVISDDIIGKSKEVRKFLGYILFGVMVFLFFFFVYMKLGFSPGLMFSLLSIALIVFLIGKLEKIFRDKKHKEVFIYNYRLFIVAILVFLVAALVETVVLSNSSTLIRIYSLSRLG